LPVEEPETYEKEPIISRKVTSATSKESKDSGCPTESITSEHEQTIPQHKGDGDQGAYQEPESDSDDGNQSNNDEPIITEHSGQEVVAAVVQSPRPVTPELCLTGVKVTPDSVRKIQTKAVLDELSASATINHTVQSPSGAVAYTYGETGDFRSPMMKLAPSRLPPIVRKTSLDRKAIEQNLQKAQHNKQKQLQEMREKLIQREERRRNVLERKRANMNLNLERDEDHEADECVVVRRRHTDDELIAPSTIDL